MNSYPIVRAHQQAAGEIRTWCALTIRQYRILCVIGGVFYGLFLLGVILIAGSW